MMSNKREIFRKNGRYEMCEITYWPKWNDEPKYILAMTDDGHEIVCHLKMGAWCQMDPFSIVGELERCRSMIQPPFG